MQNHEIAKHLMRERNTIYSISATVRDRAKRTIFGDHIKCWFSQQNIFQHFKKKIKNLRKFKKKLNLFFSLKKIKKLLSSEMVGERAKTFLNILKISKFLKKHKFALISETVRHRAKHTTFWDHMDCQWSQQNIFEHFKNFEKNNLRIQSKTTMRTVVFVHRQNAKYTWRSLVIYDFFEVRFNYLRKHLSVFTTCM